MLQLTRILCPVDFSDVSREALVHASGVAEWYDARITVLHAYTSRRVPAATPMIAGEVPILPPIHPDEVAGEVREFCARTGSVPLSRIDVAVADGDAAREILARAEALQADLIVMGTHGRGGFERLLLGSVTEKVLRRATAPVLVTPPPARPATYGLYKTILCAMDFSDASLRALEHALSFAKEADARLILLHAVEDFMDDARMAEASHFTLPKYFEHRQSDATARLEAALPAEARTWCRPEVRVVSGRASREIERVAAEVMAELIVIGVHGRGVVDRWLFGSTTDYIVRRAACPILTLRS